MQITATLPRVRLPEPPMAKGLPLVGSLPELMNQKMDFFEKARDSYGDIYTLKIGTASIVVLNHPDHAQYILRDNVRNYSKDGAFWDGIRPLLGNGLVTSEGDFWLRQRRMMNPHFHRQRLAALTEVMVQAIDECLNTWPKFIGQADPVDVTHEFARITMRIIMRTMFGSDLADDDFEVIGDKIAFALNFLLPQVVIQQLPNWLPIPQRAQYKQVIEDIDKFIYGIIDARRENLSNDLISMLLEAVDDETGETMSNKQLRDEVVTIFTAGYETTALTLSWVTHFMTQHPEIVEKLREEIDGALGDRTPGFGDLHSLPYTRQVLQEAMRLAPPSYFTPRTAVADDVIDGYHIKAGQMILMMTYVIHRHPDFWPDAHTFDPDRFSPAQSEGRHPTAWVPFGSGQRMCLGRDFAYMEGTLILVMMLQRFNMKAPEGFEAKASLSATLKPKDGILVHLSNRA